MKIVLEVSEANEATDSPWWVLIDPKMVQQIMEGVAEHGELPSTDYILGVIAGSIEGPYLSRKEAEDYLRSRHYAYSSDAKVWCASGYRADQYKQAIRRSRDLNKALNTIKGEKMEEQNCINIDTPADFKIRGNQMSLCPHEKKHFTQCKECARNYCRHWFKKGECRICD